VPPHLGDPAGSFPLLCIAFSPAKKNKKTAKSDNLNSDSNKSFLHNTSLHIVEEKVFFFWKFILEIRNKQEKMTTFFLHNLYLLSIRFCCI